MANSFITFDYSGGEIRQTEAERQSVFQREKEREIESVKRTLAVTLTRRFKHHRLYYHVYVLCASEWQLTWIERVPVQ